MCEMGKSFGRSEQAIESDPFGTLDRVKRESTTIEVDDDDTVTFHLGANVKLTGRGTGKPKKE